MTLAAILTALALTWLSGYATGRAHMTRLDKRERGEVWDVAFDYGRQVERRHLLTDLWTGGRTANPETRPRA